METIMDQVLGAAAGAVATTLVAALVQRIKSQRMLAILRAVISGLERGSNAVPKVHAKLVKRSVRAEAERTGVQTKLHALVKEITEERSK